jgi:hypothetical protein
MARKSGRHSAGVVTGNPANRRSRASHVARLDDTAHCVLTERGQETEISECSGNGDADEGCAESSKEANRYVCTGQEA